MRPCVVIIPICLMMIAIDATTKADNVVALFKFLPSNQYHQLKPQIFRILNNRPLSKQPISYQARSITTDILNAFHSVIAVHSKGRLTKRSNGVPKSDNVEPTGWKFSTPPSWKTEPREVYSSGLFDILALEHYDFEAFIEYQLGNLYSGLYHDVDDAKTLIRTLISLTSNGQAAAKASLDLENIEKLNIIDQRKKLQLMMKKVGLLVHPDKNSKEQEKLFTALFQQYTPWIDSVTNELQDAIKNDHSRQKVALFTGEDYQRTIDLIKAYEREAHGRLYWLFRKSESKIWEQIKAEFAKLKQKEIELLKEISVHKEKKQEVPEELQRQYLKHMTDKYELLKLEIQLMEEYIHKKVTKGGKALYKNRAWGNFQNHMEQRVAAQAKAVKNIDTGPLQKPMQEASYYSLRGSPISAAYTVIGGLVFVAVLAFLKDMFITKSNASNRNDYINMYGDESSASDKIYKNSKTNRDRFYDRDQDFDDMQIDFHRKKLQ